jgi:hypothetical protein
MKQRSRRSHLTGRVLCPRRRAKWARPPSGTDLVPTEGVDGIPGEVRPEDAADAAASLDAAISPTVDG